MFGFPEILVFILAVIECAAYFVMLSDRLGLRLFTFFVVSLGMTAAFLIVSVVLIPTAAPWAAVGIIQCAFYDIGSLVHLISGKRTVKEVTEKK